MDSIVDELLDRGIANATDIVIGGGSAGALGVYLNVDHYRERLDPAGVKKFSALPGEYTHTRVPFCVIVHWAWNRNGKANCTVS